jgi:hypothetical protein
MFTEDLLHKLLDNGLEVDIEQEHDILDKQHNAINRKMFDVYRLSTFLVHGKSKPWRGWRASRSSRRWKNQEDLVLQAGRARRQN